MRQTDQSRLLIESWQWTRPTRRARLRCVTALIHSGLDRAGHSPEADPGAVRARGGAADRYRVAVGEKGPRRSVVEVHRPGPVAGQLQQAAVLVRIGPAHGARGEEIPRTQARAVDGQV